MDIKGELVRMMEALPVEQQHQLLAYGRSLEKQKLQGEKGTALLAFAGVLDGSSAAEMNEAIESACESVDAGNW